MDKYILDKITISGFRGIIGDALTIESVSYITLAFIEILKEELGKENLHILIGRDGRESGVEIEQTIANITTSHGHNVVVGDILTTPSILYLTKTLTFDAAIIITASHNPEEYNGLKLIMSDGHFAQKEIILKMKNLLENNKLDIGKISNPKGEAVIDHTLKDTYINHILSAFNKPKTKIRVIVDTVNSSGSIMAPEFLKSLGTETIALNDEPIGKFARNPEPNPKALAELGRATLGYGMDVGFGLDPDGDRLALVDENGIPVFEEYTLALAAEAFYLKLSKENLLSSAGPIVINMSTSRTVEDVAKKYGIKTERSPVGEANVVKKMKETNSMFGGEGSGGVIFRPVNFGRDSFVAMALILYLLEETNKKMSELVNELPKYIMIKEKIQGVENFNEYIPKIKDLFPEAVLNTEDGLRFDFEDQSWIQVRASNTEPIVRIIGEAKEKERINALVSAIQKVF